MGDDPLDFSGLRAIFQAGLVTLDGLAETNAVAARVLQAVAQFPPEDHEAIVQVLERESRFRHLAQEASTLLGPLRYARVNPGASLYLRSTQELVMDGWDSDKIAAALLRLGQILKSLVAREPGGAAQFVAALETGLGLLSPGERELIGTMAERTAALVRRLASPVAETVPEPPPVYGLHCTK